MHKNVELLSSSLPHSGGQHESTMAESGRARKTRIHRGQARSERAQTRRGGRRRGPRGHRRGARWRRRGAGVYYSRQGACVQQQHYTVYYGRCSVSVPAVRRKSIGRVRKTYPTSFRTTPKPAAGPQQSESHRLRGTLRCFSRFNMLTFFQF